MLVFAVSGAEAVEAAIKLATMLKEKKLNILYQLKRAIMEKHLEHYLLLIQKIFQKVFHLGLQEENTINIEYNNIEAYKNIIEKYSKEKICAIILEPIQGQIVEVAKKEYLEEICNISKKNNITVIFDEIKCGLGRSGNLFSFLDYECVPDIVTTSKALGGGKNAISAMVASNKILKKHMVQLIKALCIQQLFLV